MNASRPARSDDTSPSSGLDRIEYASADRRFIVELHSSTRGQIQRHCRRAAGLETGGVLFGAYTENQRRASVRRVSGPGRGSSASQVSFVRAVGGLQAWLDRLWSNRFGYYLGEWHWHPHSDPEPSAVDREQMLSIARDVRYACPEPILLVVGGDPAREWSAVVEVFRRTGGVVQLSRW